MAILYVRNKTIIGLKCWKHTSFLCCRKRVRNKTIIGLKYFCKTILFGHSRVRNKTIIGLKYSNNYNTINKTTVRNKTIIGLKYILIITLSLEMVLEIRL